MNLNSSSGDGNASIYMPLSIILASLILAGTFFVVGAQVNDKITGLTTAISGIELKVGSGSGPGSAGNNNGNDNVPSVPNEPEPVVNAKDLVDNDPVMGDATAPVTIVEFSDYQCPFCGRFYEQTLTQLKDEYIKTGKAKLVFRDFPLSFHPEAQKAAEAAECAGKQGKYWEMHDKLFENQADLSVANEKKWAKELGLNSADFDACLDSGETADEVSADSAAGSSAGVSGTPTFFINGQKVVGAQPFSVIKAAIEAELAAAEQ